MSVTQSSYRWCTGRRRDDHRAGGHCAGGRRNRRGTADPAPGELAGDALRQRRALPAGDRRGAGVRRAARADPGPRGQGHGHPGQDHPPLDRSVPGQPGGRGHRGPGRRGQEQRTRPLRADRRHPAALLVRHHPGRGARRVRRGAQLPGRGARHAGRPEVDRGRQGGQQRGAHLLVGGARGAEPGRLRRQPPDGQQPVQRHPLRLEVHRDPARGRRPVQRGRRQQRLQLLR